MPCYRPIHAYRAKSINPETGKRPIVFSRAEGFADKPIDLPCGRCIGCRLEYSRRWAVRCVHEAQMWPENCFVTLTYNNDNLPEGGQLVKRDLQLFLKSLRRKLEPKNIRFFACGEYGELCRLCNKSQHRCSCEKYTPGPGRPHFHLAIFNYMPNDCNIFSVRNGVNLYVSETLSKVWKKGFVTVGDLNFESAAYIARYFTKKINGSMANDHYTVIDVNTGLITKRNPEFLQMSRGSKKLGTGGIGKTFFDKFSSDIYPHDFIVIRDGKKCKPPRYYDNIYDNINPTSMKKIKIRRSIHNKDKDVTELRLRQKEKCHELGAKKLIRTLEKEIT